jgi:hypothetical protein
MTRIFQTLNYQRLLSFSVGLKAEAGVWLRLWMVNTGPTFL